jgi:hypothetical protein
MKQRSALALLIIGLAVTLVVGCAEEFPDKDQECDPSEQGGPKMKVEYDYQEGYRLDDYYSLYDNVRGAFDFVGTEMTICRDASFETGDLFQLDELDGFFLTHKSSQLTYYLVSARALQENQGPGWKRWGVTNAYPSPNVPPDPKWSFIFVGDIPEEYYGGHWTKHRHVTYATIHELGHQRAGLTHPGLYPQYHQSGYPCIMDTSVTSELLNAMGFCWSSNPNSPDNCRYFLQQQNSK